MIEPSPPQGAANVVTERMFKVLLLPEGATKTVNYSGKRVTVTFLNDL